MAISSPVFALDRVAVDVGLPSRNYVGLTWVPLLAAQRTLIGRFYPHLQTQDLQEKAKYGCGRSFERAIPNLHAIPTHFILK